jgi:hypothetical protein
MGGVVSKITDAVGLTDTDAGLASMGKAGEHYAAARRAFEDIELPELEKLILEQPELVGELMPELLGPSALEEIPLDSEARDMQYAALNKLQQMADTGLSPTDIMEAQLMMQDANAQEQARQKSLLQQYDMQGLGDSGMKLAAQLQSSQGAANQKADQARQLMINAANARANAIAQLSSASSGVRGQDYGQQADAARSRDIISRFNVDVSNQAQAQNLANKQRIAENQVALQNQQQMFNQQLPQQQFSNEIAKAGGVAQGAQAQGQNMMQVGAGQQQGAANTTAGILGTAKGVAGFV